jgi:hypothetical protein
LITRKTRIALKKATFTNCSNKRREGDENERIGTVPRALRPVLKRSTIFSHASPAGI